MDMHVTLNDAFRRCGWVSNRQLQRAWNISRQAVWKRLKPLVDSGELRVEGVGRGVRYRPGSGSGLLSATVRGGDATPSAFWAALGERIAGLAYVSVAGTGRGTDRSDHAVALLEGLELKEFVILDFAGVERVGRRFALTLSIRLQVFFPTWVVINASEDLERALARAQAHERLRPKST